MKLTDQFDRVYIVNLPYRLDRRREINAELQRFNISIDGDKVRLLEAIRPEHEGNFPSIGARGCFLSHLKLINDAIKDDLENILVMEDDLQLDARFLEIQDEMCADLHRKEWDFAYFGHVAEPNQPDEFHWSSTEQGLQTTFFYALNKSVLRPLRDYLEACLIRPPGDPIGGPMHVDGAYSMFRNQNSQFITLISLPSIGHQRSSRSDVYDNKWFDKIWGIKQLVAFLRMLKNQYVS